MRYTGRQVQYGSRQDSVAKQNQRPITLAELRALVLDSEQIPDETVVQINEIQQIEGMSWSRCLRIRVVEWTEETSSVAISK